MLENILHKYFGLDENWNDDYEKERANWNKSYQELVDLIYDLEELGVLNGDKVVDKLDIIDSEESEVK